jgi:uncharacterized RmlC-like cupin family protein
MFKIIKVPSGDSAIIQSSSYDLYTYTVYVGKHEIDIPLGDSLWLVNDTQASVCRGGTKVKSDSLAVLLRGYQCESKSSNYESIVNLPYINGCSSQQIFPPVRPGDPTLQLLYLPKGTSEQAHHIHSTVRVVKVISGSGYSVQGMTDEVKVPLNPGDVLVLDKMTPHHFVTEDDYLLVAPIHVYSSTALEKNHPMRNGTFEI